jgi:hypothetical protein
MNPEIAVVTPFITTKLGANLMFFSNRGLFINFSEVDSKYTDPNKHADKIMESFNNLIDSVSLVISMTVLNMILLYYTSTLYLHLLRTVNAP